MLAEEMRVRVSQRWPSAIVIFLKTFSFQPFFFFQLETKYLTVLDRLSLSQGTNESYSFLMQEIF